MRKLIILCVAGLAAVAVSAAWGAPAKSGPRVIKRGSCGGAATWKLQLKNDDGRLETEFEVDQNVVGRRWNVVLKRNGSVVFRGARITRAPSGSFTVRKLLSRAAGGNTVVATARSGSLSCRGSASL
jgi:hypothetical protein